MATTTKNKTVIKAHRGMAHVPRGRRRPLRGFGGDPRRRPQVEPRRLGDARPQMPRGRQMTPAMRRRLMEMRLRAEARRKLPPQLRGARQMTPAQQKAARDSFNKMMESNKRMRANVFGRGRRRRPTGTPIPQQRQDRARMLPPSRANLENIKQTQQLRQAQPVGVPQEVRQAQQKPMQRPTGRRVAAKGKFITKKNIGANDFRKGGYVLSTVDNRKNKK